MKSPELIATEIVNKFAWTSNVRHKGMLVSQQVVVAEAIADAIEADRTESAAEIARLRARPTEEEVARAICCPLGCQHPQSVIKGACRVASYKSGVAQRVIALFPKVHP